MLRESVTGDKASVTMTGCKRIESPSQWTLGLADVARRSAVCRRRAGGALLGHARKLVAIGQRCVPLLHSVRKKTCRP